MNSGTPLACLLGQPAPPQEHPPRVPPAVQTQPRHVPSLFGDLGEGSKGKAETPKPAVWAQPALDETPPGYLGQRRARQKREAVDAEV